MTFLNETKLVFAVAVLVLYPLHFVVLKDGRRHRIVRNP